MDNSMDIRHKFTLKNHKNFTPKKFVMDSLGNIIARIGIFSALALFCVGFWMLVIGSL